MVHTKNKILKYRKYQTKRSDYVLSFYLIIINKKKNIEKKIS